VIFEKTSPIMRPSGPGKKLQAWTIASAHCFEVVCDGSRGCASGQLTAKFFVVTRPPALRIFTWPVTSVGMAEAGDREPK